MTDMEEISSMRTPLRWANLATLGVALTAAVALGTPVAATAAQQGPHHHPAWQTNPSVEDREVTVYREHSSSGLDRWCVTNYHHVGDLTGYSYTWNTAEVWNTVPFPKGGGHTECSPWKGIPAGDFLEVRVIYKSIPSGRQYGYDGVYSVG
jgi:hypothetical protein